MPTYMSFISFSYLTDLVSPSTTMLNRCGKGHLSFVIYQIPEGKLSFSLLGIMYYDLTISFLLKKFSSISYFADIFLIMKD